MSAMYSTLAFATSVAAGSEGANYGPRQESPAALILGAFNALGTIMFAFGGHAILLEVQVRLLAQLPSNPSYFFLASPRETQGETSAQQGSREGTARCRPKPQAGAIGSDSLSFMGHS